MLQTFFRTQRAAVLITLSDAEEGQNRYNNWDLSEDNLLDKVLNETPRFPLLVTGS